jgi:hypothetical protein
VEALAYFHCEKPETKREKALESFLVDAVPKSKMDSRAASPFMRWLLAFETNFRGHQAGAHRVTHQAWDVVNPQLIHQLSAMGLDGFDTNI